MTRLSDSLENRRSPTEPVQTAQSAGCTSVTKLVASLCNAVAILVQKGRLLAHSLDTLAGPADAASDLVKMVRNGILVRTDSHRGEWRFGYVAWSCWLPSFAGVLECTRI